MITRRALFFILALACLPALLRAEGYFTFHERARGIYEHILLLRLSDAGQEIARLKQDEPDNLIVYHLENYIDFFTVYISEDEQVYRSLLANRNRRLDLVAAGDQDSPYNLFIQAEIRLHWALLRLRFEDYLPAFSDINRAHKLLLRNQERFPDFIANRKDLGILHAAVGTVPDNFRWALGLLSSLEGTIEQGKREIEGVLNYARDHDFPYITETRVLYTFLLLHLDGRPEAAWSALEAAGLQAGASPLHAFVLANVAMRTGRNDLALQWLEARPRQPAFFAFPYLEFMHGLVKLRRLDSSARSHFRAFLNRTRGRHFIKEAYQKLAWADLLEGNLPGYRRHMQAVLQEGHAAAGGDKNALREAGQEEPPQVDLLRARLLFDGGYYDRAAQLLERFAPADFDRFEQQLEYLYRCGRVYHGQQDYPRALAFYEQTIARGREHPAFFACNAALQAGLIEEKRRRFPTARQYFTTCLELQPDEYATGLHQQAKAGLARLGN
jgi:tetratricopeptide (TPR) repeat protein